MINVCTLGINCSVIITILKNQEPVIQSYIYPCHCENDEQEWEVIVRMKDFKKVQLEEGDQCQMPKKSEL